MALFGSSKKKIEKKEIVQKGTKTPSIHLQHKSSILLRPRITEKATFLSEKGTYVFEVTEKSQKKDIVQAVKEAYKVTPLVVRIVRNPAKNVVIRGRNGVRPGVKKAYITLKKGDKIEFV